MPFISKKKIGRSLSQSPSSQPSVFTGRSRRAIVCSALSELEQLQDMWVTAGWSVKTASSAALNARVWQIIPAVVGVMRSVREWAE